MAILGFDGFEHKTTVPRAGTTFSDPPNYPAGRFSGVSMSYGGSGSNGYTHFVSPVVTGTFILGWAHTPVGAIANPSAGYVAIGSAGKWNLGIVANGATRGLELYRGDSFNPFNTLLASSALVGWYQLDTWLYYEVKCTIADSGGTCIIKVNGIEMINYTGDTRGAGTALVDAFTFAHTAVSNGQGDKFDDCYWLDTTGPAPYNDFLGDMKVETLIPSGAGASTGFTPSTAPNWDCVNELPATMTDYVGATASGTLDTYACTDLVTTTGQIMAVQTAALTQMSDAGGANLRCVSRNASGTLYRGPSTPLSASPMWLTSGVQLTDPDGAPWTIASVNAAQHGIEIP